ncbi:hypothetical protein CASFOL_038993 [Castilleja foliolosa]|uniref:RRM domain-containing protein n=1 Tax=Castilleja foliolosa TaxID=1961234 RepID=A0ABD3BJN7_9LAMI
MADSDPPTLPTPSGDGSPTGGDDDDRGAGPSGEIILTVDENGRLVFSGSPDGDGDEVFMVDDVIWDPRRTVVVHDYPLTRMTEFEWFLGLFGETIEVRVVSIVPMVGLVVYRHRDFADFAIDTRYASIGGGVRIELHSGMVLCPVCSPYF